MSGLQSVFSILPKIKDSVELFQDISSSTAQRKDAAEAQEVALRQLRQQQKLNEEQVRESAALQREEIEARAETLEADRKRALRRAVARQRAQFGSRGISTNNGSAEAILLGLFDETEEDLAARERLDNIRNRALDQGLSQQRSLNVLQRTQLRQRQNLGSLSRAVGIGSDVLDFGIGTLELFQPEEEQNS